MLKWREPAGADAGRHCWSRATLPHTENEISRWTLEYVRPGNLSRLPRTAHPDLGSASAAADGLQR